VQQPTNQSRAQAKLSIFEWIEVFYNRQRRHALLAYLSPVLMSNKLRMLSDSAKAGEDHYPARGRL